MARFLSCPPLLVCSSARGSVAPAAQCPAPSTRQCGPFRGSLLDAERKGGAPPYGALGPAPQVHRNGGVRERRITVRTQPDQFWNDVRAEAVPLAERPVHRQLLTAGEGLLQVLVAGGGQRQHAQGLPSATAVQHVRCEIVGEGGEGGRQEAGRSVGVFARTAALHRLRHLAERLQGGGTAAVEDVGEAARGSGQTQL